MRKMEFITVGTALESASQQAREIISRHIEFLASYNTSSSEAIGETIRSLQRSCQSGSWLSRAREAMSRISKEPWCSSLWVLQEAFLQFRTRIITSKGDISLFRLKTLSLYVARLVSVAEIILGWKTTSGSRLIGTCLDIFDYDQDIGFTCLRSQQSIAVFQLSFHRKPSEETDHIYGIQQILGYRLGKSATPGESGTTLEALEVEFGAKMLERDPVRSQLHTFLKAPEEGNGWRMNRSSEMLPSINSGELFRRLCLFSYRFGSVSKQPLAHFDGMVLPFSKLRESWQSDFVRYLAVDVGRIPELEEAQR